MARQTNLCHTTLQLPFKVLEFLTAFLKTNQEVWKPILGTKYSYKASSLFLGKD